MNIAFKQDIYIYIYIYVRTLNICFEHNLIINKTEKIVHKNMINNLLVTFRNIKFHHQTN